MKPSVTASLKLDSKQQKLFDGYQHLVARAVARYGRADDPDDIGQEASIALIKACRSYDARRKVPFGAYAWKCIQNRWLDLLKRRPQPPSHDVVVGQEECGEDITLFDKVERRAAREELRSRSEENCDDRVYQARYVIQNQLTGIERQAMTLRFDDEDSLTLAQLAKRLGVSKSTAHRALNTALARLRKRLKNKLEKRYRSNRTT